MVAKGLYEMMLDADDEDQMGLSCDDAEDGLNPIRQLRISDGALLANVAAPNLVLENKREHLVCENQMVAYSANGLRVQVRLLGLAVGLRTSCRRLVAASGGAEASVQERGACSSENGEQIAAAAQ